MSDEARTKRMIEIVHERDSLLKRLTQTQQLLEADNAALKKAEKRLKWAEAMIDFARIIFTTLDGPGADVWLEHLKKGPVNENE